MESQLLNDSQVSEIYGLTKPWLRRVRREHRGPRFLRLGNKMIRYRREDIEAYLAAQTVETEAPRTSDMRSGNAA
jgi:predicted DNA-binding transcriptional regulator AlpA